MEDANLMIKLRSLLQSEDRALVSSECDRLLNEGLSWISSEELKGEVVNRLLPREYRLWCALLFVRLNSASDLEFYGIFEVDQYLEQLSLNQSIVENIISYWGDSCSSTTSPFWKLYFEYLPPLPPETNEALEWVDEIPPNEYAARIEQFVEKPWPFDIPFYAIRDEFHRKFEVSVRAPIECGSYWGSGGGTYFLMPLGVKNLKDEDLSYFLMLSSVGPYASLQIHKGFLPSEGKFHESLSPLKHSEEGIRHMCQAVCAHIGLRMVDSETLKRRLEGFYILQFGEGKELCVSDLLFFWQD